MLGKLRSETSDMQRHDTRDSSMDQPYADEPLRVSINGLENNGHIQNCFTFYSYVIDKERILASYCEWIQRRFVECALLDLKQFQSQKVGIKLRTPIMDCARFFTKATNNNPGFKKYLQKGTDVKQVFKIDATGIFAKYGEFAWANDIQLERLSIRELGLQDFHLGPSMIGRGNREIARAALPGTSEADLNVSTEMDDVVYTRVKRQYGIDPTIIYDVTSRGDDPHVQ